MAVFNFESISPSEALAIQPTDVLAFSGGPARLATVAFSPLAEGQETISITFAGHTVTFGSGLATLSLLGRVTFADGSALVAGAPGDDHRETSAPNSAMFGGAGNDFLFALRGENVLQGNQGDDTVVAGFGSDTLFGGQGNDIIATDSPDDDGFIPNGVDPNAPHADFAQGNLGNDTIIGGNGADVLLGGQGDDSIRGGGGGDWISGDRGNDTLSGEAGADVFFAVSGGGDDRVLDFNGAEGDRVRVEAGIAFDIHQDGADTLIIVDHGSSTMRLVGIQMSTLHADWIVGT